MLSGRSKIHPEKQEIKIIQHFPTYETATADQIKLLTRSNQYFPKLKEVRPPPSYNETMERPTIIRRQREAEAQANKEQAQANTELDEAIRIALAQEEEEP